MRDSQGICRLNINRPGFKYESTKKGVAGVIYRRQRNSKIISRRPSYTFYEFYDWLFSIKEFHKLYYGWVKSGYEIALRPSVDRIDETKGYSMDNIQVLVLRENIIKGTKFYAPMKPKIRPTDKLKCLQCGGKVRVRNYCMKHYEERRAKGLFKNIKPLNLYKK